jgi:hypothetical protein
VLIVIGLLDYWWVGLPARSASIALVIRAR